MRKLLIATAFCVSLALSAMAADEPGSSVPDLTKGGKLTRINKRWVGPVGILCGSWRVPHHRHMDQPYVRQLLVLEVDEGSPADGILAKGDVILGADGSGAGAVPLFQGAESTMIPIANAVTEAESRDPALLKLLRWREGTTETVTVQLQTLGTYSDTAPFDCPKSKRILRQGIKTLYESNHPGRFSLGILCLLAADDPTQPDNEKYQARAREWAHRLILSPDEDYSSGAWNSGHELIVLAEYYMKTGDEAVFPTLVRRAEYHARGVSWFGTTGHRWCEKKPDGSGNGRLAGYGPINCSGAAGFLGLSLARKAGVRSPVVDAAIERADIFFGHYAFRGGIGYGEMPYGINGGTDDHNGVHAMAGFALGLQENREKEAVFFSKKAALSSHQSRGYAHGGPFFGQVWQPLGAAQAGPKAANLQFREIRWHLDLKRRWDGQRIYDPTNNKYGRGAVNVPPNIRGDFNYAAAALLFYALPLRQLYITGRGQKESLRLSDAEFEDLLVTDRFDPASATDQELVAALSRTQGMLRGKAGGELARRIKEAPGTPESAALVDQLLALATDSKAGPTARTGACAALMALKEKTRGAAGELKNAEIARAMAALLKDPAPYIRFGAVRVLQALNPDAVRPHMNEILDAAVRTARPTFPLNRDDPVQWAHGELGVLLADHLLKDSLEGVDPERLIPALRALLQTPNGRGCSRTARLLSKLTMQQMLDVADVIVDNIMVPPPANAMGGSGAPACQAVLAKYNFEEAMPLSVIYGPGDAIKNKIPQKYGKSALAMESAREFMQSLGDEMLVKAVDAWKVVDGIKDGAGPETLNRLKRLETVRAAEPTLRLPAAQTALHADATNYGRRGEDETTYTWRKVHGAGAVRFTPNGTATSNRTTVSFTDRKPGTYRFEVTMADTLGYNVLRKTVDVTLFGENGVLPANAAPKAISQSLKAVPGLPTPVALSGTDPDGDDLGFVVIQPPAHGTLSGVGGQLRYTAHFGFNGMDRFTFHAVDGQGKAAAGTVEFAVSDKDVGVVVYEGFDYENGALLDREGGSSFGFSGPWTNSKATTGWYLVADGSLRYPDLPSTGGKLTKGKIWWPCSRPLDREVLAAHALLDNGSELWFSVIVHGVSNGRFRFGLKGGEAEAGADLGFTMEGGMLQAAWNGKPSGTSRVGWGRHKSNIKFPPHTPHMIIGRCVWAEADDEPDTLEIYRVFDAPGLGPLVLKKPVCVMTEVIPQAQINTLYMFDTTGGVDEIRIGRSLHSVLLGTKPLPPER